MGIKDTKTRTMITLDREFLEELKIEAEKDSRSLNSLMVHAIKEYMKTKKGVDD